MVVRNVANIRVVKNITMHRFDCFSELKGTKVLQYKKHDIQSPCYSRLDISLNSLSVYKIKTSKLKDWHCPNVSTTSR